jgi:hypothetical protein
MTTRLRGSTLIEVMVAAVILLTGLTGASILLIRGASAAGNGAKSLDSVLALNDTLTEVSLQGFTSLATQVGANPSLTLDGGLVTIGGREYRRSYSLLNRSDGGAGSGLVEVIVRLDYRDTDGINRSRTASTLVSESPDASF